MQQQQRKEFEEEQEK